ncbi:MAG: class I tRNA ligase family protein, partial [Desulfobulbaceae bacterium]|nr:class I tRNA ligase family protein [Candidatus Desulfatifera sulfidica]
IFPHHENELAQSEGASGTTFVNSWIHHGFVTIRDEKMSKSLGNFLTIRDILAHYHPEVLRFFIFSTHYRNPLDFSETAMQDAMAGLDRLYQCVAAIDELDGTVSGEGAMLMSAKDQKKIESMEVRFQQAMDNDFNTAQAQGLFFDLSKILNKVLRQLPEQPATGDLELLRTGRDLLQRLAGIMGLLQEDASHYLAAKKAAMLEELSISEDEINELIDQRRLAREAKDWAGSDAIRDKLLEARVELEDGADGTCWRVKRT